MAVIQVPVTKAKATVEINTDDIPEEVYRYAVMLGLKTLVNRGMSKIIGTSDQSKAAALEVGKENIEKIKAGKVRMVGVTRQKGDAALMTEARRIARLYVKQGLKEAGEKISHYSAKDITEAANALIQSDPAILEEAKANLANRAEAKPKVNIKDLIKADPKLVAKAEAGKKPKAGGAISAHEAGKTAVRQKPAPQHR